MCVQCDVQSQTKSLMCSPFLDTAVTYLPPTPIATQKTQTQSFILPSISVAHPMLSNLVSLFLSLSHDSFSTFLVATYSLAEKRLQEGQHSLSLHIFSANSLCGVFCCLWIEQHDSDAAGGCFFASSATSQKPH